MSASNSLGGLYISMGANDVGVDLAGSPSADWTQGGVGAGMGNRGRGPATPTAWAPTDTSYKTLDPWNAVLPWFIIWIGANNTATNTGVNISNIEIFAKEISTGKWVDIGGGRNNPSWPNEGSGVSFREESDGSRTYFFDGVKNSQSGNAIHGGTVKFAITGDDISCVYARLETMMLLQDTGGADDRAGSEYYVDVGADYWPQTNSVVADFTPMTYVPAVGNSRFQRIPVHKKTIQLATINPPGDNSGYTFVGARTMLRSDYELDIAPPMKRFNSASSRVINIRR